MPTSTTEAAATDRLTLRLRRMAWEADGVLSLDFAAPDASDLPAFEPGAHVDLHMPDGQVRQYSLCGDPADRSHWRVAIRAVEGGRVSGAIHRTLRPGVLMPVGLPRNNFAFVPAPRYLFIAGGIGITPLLPMMRAATRAGAPWTLLFCARRTADAPFLAEACALGGDIALHISEQGTRLDVAARLATAPPDTMLYCCSPETLMTAVEAATQHWPDGAVRFEWFTPRARPEDEASGTFEVHCAQSGVTIIVPPQKSVLAALADANIEVQSSCEQGICGTCECRVLEGEIDHRDSILSAAEQAANQTMMVCVSRAKSARVVLDL
jgi:ferredoxin-NADP reductase